LNDIEKNAEVDIYRMMFHGEMTSAPSEFTVIYRNITQWLDRRSYRTINCAP
jgi:hypothetical protein